MHPHDRGEFTVHDEFAFEFGVKKEETT